jgi:hypothetical protein
VTKPFVLFIQLLKEPPRLFGWKSYWTEQSAQDAFKSLLKSECYLGEISNIARIEGCGMTSWLRIENESQERKTAET